MKDNDDNQIEVKKKCGIIMPIANHADYPTGHWKEVLLILIEAVNETEFEPRLVSDDVAIGLIHERIVNNIYTDEIAICDVSSKNPNVMFELGMRLAFDKPTIIIKDEKTGYSFDTGVIEHLNYPSSLRFNQIVEFKSELIKKILATYDRSQKEPNYSPFLKSFGKTIVPAKIHQTEIAESKYILSKLESLANDMKLLRIDQNQNNTSNGIQRNSSERQKLSNLFIKDFLTMNNHLPEQDIRTNFVEILQDEINQRYGFKPQVAEIVIALNNFYHVPKIKEKS
ncbi:MAG: RNA helicase [Flavobacterium sp.]|nr:RNA helicase [Flavobacterium sp.]